MECIFILYTFCRFGRKFELRKPVEEYQMFYIGFEGPSLTNLILNYNRCQVKLTITNQYSRTISIFILFLMWLIWISFFFVQFCTYNPITRKNRRETINVNKALGRRYYYSVVKVVIVYWNTMLQTAMWFSLITTSICPWWVVLILVFSLVGTSWYRKQRRQGQLGFWLALLELVSAVPFVVYVHNL